MRARVSENIAQLEVFIRSCGWNVVVAEELLELLAISGTTVVRMTHL
jgi:hypothetical protein